MGETDNAATTTTLPVAEAKQPVGPTVEELQAQIADIKSDRNKEVGDRDRGLARQAETLKQLTERLALAEKAADALAKRTFGMEDDSPPEYKQWAEAYKPKTDVPKEFALSPLQAISIGEMKASAKYYGVDYNSPPQELKDVINEVATLFETDPEKAAEIWEKGLKIRDNQIKLKAESETKAKKEETEKRAKLGTRDSSTSTGGAKGNYRDIVDAWMKNPNDPATKQAYLEARRARGV